MKSLLVLLLIVFSSTTLKAQVCDLSVEEVGLVQIDKVAYAQKLVDMGLGSKSYVSRWSIKDERAQGPFPARKGDMLVVGLEGRDLQAWLREVGKNTIGLSVEGLPESSPGTANLRVGKDFYTYGNIQGRGMSNREMRSEWTEATFEVTPQEMTAIKKFIQDRQAGRIKAKFDIRRGPEEGERIRPSFDSDKATLVEESCAGACSSFFNPKWLEHYEAPEVLLNLKKRLQLHSSHVAKHMIWKHARSPELLSLTIHRIENSEKSLVENFIKNNSWGPLRGQPVHALIPDPKTPGGKSFNAKRIRIEDWLAE